MFNVQSLKYIKIENQSLSFVSKYFRPEEVTDSTEILVCNPVLDYNLNQTRGETVSLMETIFFKKMSFFVRTSIKCCNVFTYCSSPSLYLLPTIYCN